MTGLPRRSPIGSAGRPTVLVTVPSADREPGRLETYALNISRDLARDHRWRVVVVTSARRGGRPAGTGEEDGLRVYRLPAGTWPSAARLNVAWSGRFRDILNVERPDLINAHAPGTALACPAGGRAAVPLVLSWHAGGTQPPRAVPDTRPPPLERVLRRRLLSRAAWVIASSDAVRDTCLAPVRAKCTTVAPGIDTGRFAPAPVRNTGRVLFVAGQDDADADDGLLDVFHAVVQVVRDRDSATLDVVGAGAACGAFEALAASLGIGDRVRFQGHLGGEGLAEALRGTAVVVLPRKNGESPGLLLEAMAFGLPVVSTAVGDTVKLIDHGRTGFLVPDGRPALLARRLGELLDNPSQADAFGASARRKAMSSPTWAAQAAHTSDLFAEVLAGRSPNGRRNLAVVAPFYAPKTGGLERYAEEIAHGLVDRHDWDVTVFTANHAARRTTVEVRDAMTVHRLRPWLTISNTPVNPMWFWYLRRAFAANRVDAVHVHTPVPFLADLAGVAAGSRPLVVTYHAGSMVKGRQPVDTVIRCYERVVLPRLLRRADALVAVSASVQARFFAGHRDKASIISPGVDAIRFAPQSSTLEQARPTVLYVGKIATSAEWKGLAQLVDAFAIMVERVPTARLVLVGEGDAAGIYLEQAQRGGVGASVDLLGELGGDDLVSAYQRATVVVLPSLTEAESFGMSLIEAMACAKPVVGSRVGGIPFVIDDGANGLLVPPGDVKALADACVRLLDNPQLAGAFGAAGRAKVVANYTWTDQVDRYAALLETHAAGGSHIAPR